jgi:excisionase family DNA binding protein
MTTTQLDNDPLLNIDQTAAVLKITRPTITAMLKDGTAPPFITIGRRRFILTSELRRWVESKHRRAKSAQNKQRREVHQSTYCAA